MLQANFYSYTHLACRKSDCSCRPKLLWGTAQPRHSQPKIEKHLVCTPTFQFNTEADAASEFPFWIPLQDPPFCSPPGSPFQPNRP